jgi:hypothetical protein
MSMVLAQIVNDAQWPPRERTPRTALFE